MKTTILALIALVVGASALGIAVSYKPAPVVGSSPGQDISFRQFFRDNIIVGGYDYATSSIGAATYPVVPFMNAKLIEQQAASALTVTLPTGASLSSAGYLQNIGDTDIKYIHASTTAITLAGNTGLTLSSASSTTKISAGTTGILTCARLGTTEARLIQCLLVAD